MPAIPAPLRFTEQGRSGTRMLMAMQVTISGKAHAGRAFEEKTRTVVINRTGCKLVTEQQLAVGSQLTMSVANGKRTASVSIVWVGEKKGKQLEVGVDFDTPDPNFWGVMFTEDPSAPSPQPQSSTPPATAIKPALAFSPATKVSLPVTTPIVPALSLAKDPTSPSPVLSGTVPRNAGPAPIPGDLASSSAAMALSEGTVVPISVRRPQMNISDDGLKSIGGDLLLGMVQHLVREAFQEVLTQVTEDFDRYCVSTIERAKSAAITEMQDRLRAAVTVALQPALEAGVAGVRVQLDNAARQISAQQAKKLESSMQQALENTEKALESRAHTYDQRLAATAGQFCQDLARRLYQNSAA